MRAPLRITEPGRDCPSLITAYATQGRGAGRLEVALRLTASTGAFVAGGEAGFWVWRSDAGNAPSHPSEQGDPVSTLQRVVPLGQGQVTRRGTWKGSLEVAEDGFPRIQLERTIGYVVVRIVNDVDGRWRVTALRGERWFSVPVARGTQGGAPTLGEAVDQAFTLALELSAEVCGVRDTERRGAHDAAYAAAHPERAATVPADPTVKVLRRVEVGLALVGDQELLHQVAGELAVLDLPQLAERVRALRTTDAYRSLLQEAPAMLVRVMGKPLDPHRWNAAVAALHAPGGRPWAPTAPQGCPGPMEAAALPQTVEEADEISRLDFTAFSKRAVALCNLAESLISAPSCTGPAQAEAQARLQVARSHLEVLRIGADDNGLNLVRAVLVEPAGLDEWRVRLVKSGRIVTAKVAPERAALLVAGGVVVVALAGSEAHVTELRLDLVQTAAIDAPAVADVVRANRYVLDQAALAAARAARACVDSDTATVTPSGERIETAVRCFRCGLVAATPVHHLAVGSLLCTNSLEADQWVRVRGPGVLYLVQHFHGAVVEPERIRTRPTAIPLPLSADWLATLPVYTVLAFGRKPDEDQGVEFRYPGMLIRLESQLWHYYSVTDGARRDGADDAEVVRVVGEVMAKGEVAEGWVLVPGRGGQHAHRSTAETAARVAVSLARLPGWGSKLRAEAAHEHNAFMDRGAVNLSAFEPWKWVSDMRARLGGQLRIGVKQLRPIPNKRELGKLGKSTVEGWTMRIDSLEGSRPVPIAPLVVVVRHLDDGTYQATLRDARDKPMGWTQPASSRVLALRELGESITTGRPLTVEPAAEETRPATRPGKRTREARAARAETAAPSVAQVAAPPEVEPVHIDQPPAGGADDGAILNALLASIKAVGAELRGAG